MYLETPKMWLAQVKSQLFIYFFCWQYGIPYELIWLCAPKINCKFARSRDTWKPIIIEVLSNVNFVRMFQNQQHGFSPLLHSVYSNEMGMFNIQCIILNRATWQNTFLANFFHVEMSIKTNQTRSHVLSLFQNHHFLSGINALCVVKFIICLCIFSTCCCLCWDSNLK